MKEDVDSIGEVTLKNWTTLNIHILALQDLAINHVKSHKMCLEWIFIVLHTWTPILQVYAFTNINATYLVTMVFRWIGYALTSPLNAINYGSLLWCAHSYLAIIFLGTVAIGWDHIAIGWDHPILVETIRDKKFLKSKSLHWRNT